MGNIRYIGSKLRVASQIINSVEFHANGAFCDLFSGTGAISRAAAIKGWRVEANDYLLSAYFLTTSQLLSEDDVPFSDLGGYEVALAKLNRASGICGPITKEYSPSDRSHSGHTRLYFSLNNAMQIDGIRALIQEWYNNGSLSEFEYALLIADLLRASNSVANIAGTYGGYLKQAGQSALRPLLMSKQELLKNKVEFIVSKEDVFNRSAKIEDVVYMDPPYTKRQYPAYYHILETIAYGDHPVVEGVTGLRPWQHLASRFCYKGQALSSLIELVEKVGSYRCYISYSSQGHINIDELITELGKLGSIQVYKLGSIGKYRPNIQASRNSSTVDEYLIGMKLASREDEFFSAKLNASRFQLIQ